MKKVFKFLMMVLLGLFAGVGTTWGQGISMGDVDLNDPASWFYVNLEAKVSTPACGSNPGQVKLNYTNTKREQDNPWITGAKPANPYDEELEWGDYDSWRDGWNVGVDDATAGKARNEYPDYYYVDNDPTKGFIENNKRPEGHDAAWDWYTAGHALNTASPTAWGASANLNGYALFHMEGVDSALNGMFSSYAYFEAKVKENDGWYFTGWSFTEGESDLGGAVDTDTPEDKGKLFKIFPADNPGWNNKSQEYVYATFKPVMVANYTVNGTIDVTPGNGNSGNNTVIFDVQGDRVSADDFTASVVSAAADGYTGHGTCAVSHALVNGQIVVTVTYMASDAESGIYRANVTLASKSGCSSLTAPMYVRVSAAAGSEAALYNGKADPANFVASGTLAEMISQATAEQTVAINADYTNVVTINKDVIFDLNGYELSNNLVVSGGNVTLAYSKFGGKITKTVAVQSGATLTLNGGTIEVNGNGSLSNPADAVVAVNVANGGKLIQNGATISATALTCYAIGINVNGSVTVKDGSITAHANMTAAFAAQVSATGKLTTTGGAFNASVNQSHNPSANPADQSTWSNAYAVYVTATTGEATIKGGTFNSTSSYDGAFAVCALATFGKMTIEKGAVVTAHTVRSLPVAYAVGSMGSADLTVNGGRFSATYVEDEQLKSCSPFLCADFANLDFKAGYIKADSVFVRDDMFAKTATLVQPKLYNLTYKGQDYMDGYRYLAVREGLDAKAYGMQAARIGTTGYTSVVDAIAYANNNTDKDVVIILQNDDEIPAGYYTIPSKATLIIPMKNEQETGNTIIPRVTSITANPVAYVQPTPYVTLTVAPGANIDVHGTIEVSGTQRSSDHSYASLPHGPCGFVDMQEGSNMTMQSGSELRAWGFIIGKGETDVRRNATVREQFQMGDWKGGSTSFGMLSDDRRVFPLTHYYIQNIESPFKYHPGAILSTTTSVSASFGGLAVTAAANDIKVVGVSGRDDAMFLMDNEADADNTWVRKWYDVENDLQVYDVNNSAHIGSMVLDLGKLGNTPLVMNSGYFVLPITCNMKIHLLSGLMDFTQNTALLPGAEVEIDKEATVTIVKNIDESVLSGSLYIYDADQWDKYAYDESANGGIKYTKPVMYAAGFGGQPTARADQFYNQEKLKDASINVHGSFAINEANCFLYTSEGGANIFSSNEDAGTFVFNEVGPTESTQEQVWQVKNRNEYNDGHYFTAAQLKNKEGHEPAFTNTTGYDANASICYMDDEWRFRTYFDCYSADVDMDVYAAEAVKKAQKDLYGMPIDYDLGKAVEHIYIKPQEWVEIVGKATIEFNWSETPDPEQDPYHPYLVGVEGNADHTYSDAAGAGRLFIMTLTDQYDCDQWWEVEKKDNLYHCIHPLNDTYYYWGEDENGMERWMEKKFTITWKNWNGDIIQTTNKDGYQVDSYEVTYGTMAEFLGTNPTRESNIDYTYDFTGWTPALGPVTSDVTYTATFTQKPRMYTIIFQQEGGVEIERHFLTHNEMPVCENTPTKPGHTLEWTPAIKAVTGDQTYVATWHEDPPTEYEVTFYDYNGTTVLKQGDVAVGATPVAPAIVNGKPQKEDESFGGKPATNEFTYVFDHWSPALEEVSATSIKSYTAVYAEVAKTYTIKFVKENGDPSNPEDVIESHQYQYGETPICANTPTKDATAQYTYKLRWTPQIQTVMADANYTAVFDATLNKYAVSVMSNPSGACAISGAGIYDYSTAADAVAITITPNSGYTFTGWSDDPENTNTTRQMAITADINLVANFDVEDPDVTITWKSEDGNTILAEVGQKENTATIYTGATPTKAADAHYTYTFDGWTTEANGAGTFYKNNMTPKATASVPYYAHFAATEVIMEIGLGQAQNIAEGTTVNQLILNSNGTVSGQLTGNIAELDVKGDCYYDLTGTFTAGKWYAVAVPWQVTAGDIRANGNALSWMSGDYLAYYDGAVRAAQGTVDACWKYIRNSDVLEPGRLYMLYLANNASVLRFPKKAGAPILNASASISAYASAEATDANWNGIANPAIFYAYLNNTGATVGQVFNADAQSYEAVALSNKLIVAKPIFVQATNTGSAMAVTTPPTSAPIRRNANVETQKAECQVTITSCGRMQDRLFIHADENKEADTYTVGQDVLKFGVSSSVAQMWVNRYDAKLCMNTMAPVNNVAEYPLSIYAPKDGDYTIAIEKEQVTDDYALYLTYNGEAIWNLSDGAYTANLEKGTDANYGLRITFKAPEVATGIDEAIVDSKDATAAKVLINGHVFIIREGVVYTVNGQLVK